MAELWRDWPKRRFDCQLQEAHKKTLIGPQLPQWRQSVSLHTWCHQGPHKPSSCSTFTLNSHWGRAATGKKCLASMHAGLLWLCPTLCNLVDCVACQPSLLCVCVGVFYRLEYWSLFAKTSCHTLLEHYISYYSSCQFP